MKCLLLIVGLLVAGCMNGSGNDPAPDGRASYYWHDAAHRVSCWQSSGGGVSCLPDSQVNAP